MRTKKNCNNGEPDFPRAKQPLDSSLRLPDSDELLRSRKLDKQKAPEIPEFQTLSKQPGVSATRLKHPLLRVPCAGT
jgi:hypothetical protein